MNFKGFKYPLQFGQDGVLAMSEFTETDDTLLVESMQHICLTVLKSRIRKRRYGAALTSQTFKIVSSQSPGTAAQLTREAIVKWEPRVNVHTVKISDNDDGTSLVVVYYSPIGIRKERQASFTI